MEYAVGDRVEFKDRFRDCHGAIIEQKWIVWLMEIVRTESHPKSDHLWLAKFSRTSHRTNVFESQIIRKIFAL